MTRKIAAIFLFITLQFIPFSYAVDLADVEIHGFISQGFLYSDSNNYLTAETSDGSFQFNELGINFSIDLTDSLRIGLQIFSGDLGDVGNNKVIIDWAYGDYRWKDWLGIRAGVIRMSQGFYNETRDIDSLRTNILLPQSVYWELQREFFARTYGGGLYGEISLNSMGSLSYQALIGTSNIDDDGGVAKLFEFNGLFNVRNVSEGTAYNGSLQWHTPLDGLRIGISGASADMDLEEQTTAPLGPLPPGTQFTFQPDDFWTFVVSAEYTWNDLILAAEYMQMKADYSAEGIPMLANENHPEGGYVSAAYRFADWFEAGCYYSVYYDDKDDHSGNGYAAAGQSASRGWQKDFCLSTRFDINEYWIVKLEGHAMDGTAQVMAQDNPDGLEKDWYLFAAKVTFNF